MKMKDKIKKLGKIFIIMFRIGLFTFGGGLVMIPQMSRDFADKYGWLEKEEIVDFFSVAQSLPGVVAVNASVMIGYRLAGVAGAVAAAFGAILPSLLVLIGVTIFYEAFISSPIVLGAMRGIRAAVTALLFYTALSLRKGSLTDAFCWVLFIAAAAISLFTDINVVFLLLGGALMGIVFTLVAPRIMKKEIR